MNSTNPATQLPIYLCTLWLYNDDYYDDDNRAPEWIHSCDRLIAARNQHRAELLFIETLEKQQVYLPRPDERQIEVSEFPDWPKYYSVEQFNQELIRDTESEPASGSAQEGPAPLTEFIAAAYRANPSLLTIWQNEWDGIQQINLIGKDLSLNFARRFSGLLKIVSEKNRQQGPMTNIELRISLVPAG